MTTPSTNPIEAAEEPIDRRDFLWRTLGRYDIYISTTISRAAAVTALNALAVGGIIIKSEDILASFGAHTGMRWIALCALTVAALAALASTLLSFLALVPYMGNKAKNETSFIFFAHVANRREATFVKRIQVTSDSKLLNDLAQQVHDVANGLATKFKLLKVAAYCTVAGLLPALALLGGTILIRVVIDW